MSSVIKERPCGFGNVKPDQFVSVWDRRSRSCLNPEAKVFFLGELGVCGYRNAPFQPLCPELVHVLGWTTSGLSLMPPEMPEVSWMGA